MILQAMRYAAGLVLVLTAVSPRAAPAQPDPPIVAEGWEITEQPIDIGGGVMQLRVRRKPAVAAVAAPSAPAVARTATSAAPPAGTSGEPNPVAAAKPPAADALKKVLAVDLSVPSSPAMAVLGMTGTEVQRPGFARDLASSLVRGFDKDGKPKNAFAVDINPVALFWRDSINGGIQYAQEPWMQIRARTTVSLAASQVEGSKDASQLAAGIRVGIIDRGDPGLFWQVRDACVKRAIQVVAAPTSRDLDIPPELDAAIKRANVDCAIDNLVSDLWAKPALYTGYAQAWHAADGRASQARASAKTLWISYSQGISPVRSKQELKDGSADEAMRALLQLYAARKRDDRVKASAESDTLVREDRNDLIARLRVGKEKWHAFLDAGVSRVRTAGLARDNVRRIGLGVEYQLREDLWLVASSVTERGFAAGDRQLISTGLRFGQVPEALFDPAPPKK